MLQVKHNRKRGMCFQRIITITKKETTATLESQLNPNEQLQILEQTNPAVTLKSTGFKDFEKLWKL